MLLERTGADMTMIRAQLDKLEACAGEGGTLSETEVGGLVSERLETKVFDLVDAVGHRDRRGAISRYDELLRMQEEPNRILYFLGRQFNQLYLMKVMSQKGKGTVEMMKVMDLRYSFQIRKLSDQAVSLRQISCGVPLQTAQPWNSASRREKSMSGWAWSFFL